MGRRIPPISLPISPSPCSIFRPRIAIHERDCQVRQTGLLQRTDIRALVVELDTDARGALGASMKKSCVVIASDDCVAGCLCEPGDDADCRARSRGAANQLLRVPEIPFFDPVRA